MGSKVTARIKIKGKLYEINVDLDEALKVKEGKGDITSALTTPCIFSDIKKGTKASEKDLKEAFETTDVYEIAKKIIISGEVQKTQEYREAERELKVNKVINLLIKNAVDQNGRPYTEERMRRLLEEAHCSIDNRPPEQQIHDIVEKLQKIAPIKIEIKRIRLIIPSRFVGQAYGMLKEIKESEEWLPNGDLEAIIKIPAGMQIDFFDKLNSIAHGLIKSEELPSNS